MGSRRFKHLRSWDSIGYVYCSQMLFWRYQLWAILHLRRVLRLYTRSKKKGLRSKQSCFGESSDMHDKPVNDGGKDMAVFGNISNWRPLHFKITDDSLASVLSKTVMTDNWYSISFNDQTSNNGSPEVSCSSDRSNNLGKWWIGSFMIISFWGQVGLVNLNRLDWAQHDAEPGAGMLVAKVVVRSICAREGAPSPIVRWVSDCDG